MSLNLQPERLRGSGFDTPEDLITFSRKFDEGVKRVFSNDQASQYVKFGSPRDNKPEWGIRTGRLALTGYAHIQTITKWNTNLCAYRTQVSGFFEPSIQSTVDTIRGDLSQRLAPDSVRTLGVSSDMFLIIREQLTFLVGGFAASRGYPNNSRNDFRVWD